MKIKLLTIGKTKTKFLEEGIQLYAKRLKHYITFEYIELNDVKKMTVEQTKKAEAELVLKHIDEYEHLFLLDESGTEYNSQALSSFLQEKMNNGLKSICFVIGGAHGFSDELYKSMKGKMALSRMTFTHEMARLFFVEQIYRAMTILKREKYHH